MTVRRIAALLLMLVAVPALAACGTAQPTAYAPAGPGGGYAERPIAGGLFEVTFAGNSVTSPERVEAFALYRAAELAADRGADRLAVLDKTLHRQREIIREWDPWPGYVGYGFGSRSGSGVSVGTRFPLYGPRSNRYSFTRYRAELLVRPLPPGVPADTGAVIHSVPGLLQQLGPMIQRPLPAG